MERYLHEVATEEVPVFHPYLYGSREDARASAGFRGIRAHHDVRHLLRAVYEGVAFNHADHLANLTVAVPPQRLTLVGGGTRSREFTRILAGTLNRPIEVFASDLVTAKGAAVVGMVGAGVYRSLIESMRALVTQGETVYPEAVYVRNAVARRKTYDEVRDSLAQRLVTRHVHNDNDRSVRTDQRAAARSRAISRCTRALRSMKYPGCRG